MNTRTFSMKIFRDESGISLIELLVVMSLLAIVMAAVTGMMVSGMTTQAKIDARLRAQLDARQVIYDMEKTMSEANRQDASGNRPVFGDDMVTFPSQGGTKWFTYIYTTPPGANSPTIVRKITTGEPALPVSVTSSDKQMIGLGGDGLTATVDRASGGPIFTYYGADGNQIATDATTHVITDITTVRSIKVSFETTVSEGHAQHQPVPVSTQIDLRNFNVQSP